MIPEFGTEESGFTLIELIITMFMMVLVMSSLTFAAITGLGTADKTQNRLLQSHDTQLVSFYLVSDMNSADQAILSGATDAMPAPCNAGVPTANGASTNLVQFRWTDKTAAASNTYAVAYRAEAAGSAFQIVRYFCNSATGNVTNVIVLHNLKNDIQCPISGYSVCVTASATRVSITITTAISGIEHSFTLSGNGRTPALIIPPVNPPVLLSLVAVTASPAAGAADNLTITAKDSLGNTATTYTGDKALTFTGPGSIGVNNPTVTDKQGAATAFGTPATITFTNGVATATGSSNGAMTLYRAQIVNVVVTDGTVNNGAGLPVTVAAGAPALTFSPPCSSFATKKGGGGTNGQTSITVRRGTDVYGNTVVDPNASTTVSISFSGAGGSWAPPGPLQLSGAQTSQTTWTNSSSAGVAATPTASAPNNFYVSASCNYTTTTN